ncbi:hypothetical protein ACVFVO_17680 [Advenella kashmirensis]
MKNVLQNTNDSYHIVTSRKRQRGGALGEKIIETSCGRRGRPMRLALSERRYVGAWFIVEVLFAALASSQRTLSGV